MTSRTLAPVAAETAPPPPAGPSHLARQVRDLLLVLVAGLALLTAGVTGYGLAGRNQLAAPTTSSVEAGFARDMSVHHAQAVQMSLMAHDNTTDPLVKYMTYDIATGQQAQLGMMTGWLTDWGLTATATSQTPMSWMTGSGMTGHRGGSVGEAAVPDGTTGAATSAPGGMAMRLLADGRMPGMASAADLARLKSLRGAPADILWLQLMIAHHRGGVDMARTAVALTDRPSVRALAQSIVDSQSAEITTMQDMLRQRGAPPA